MSDPKPIDPVVAERQTVTPLKLFMTMCYILPVLVGGYVYQTEKQDYMLTAKVIIGVSMVVFTVLGFYALVSPSFREDTQNYDLGSFQMSVLVSAWIMGYFFYKAHNTGAGIGVGILAGIVACSVSFGLGTVYMQILISAFTQYGLIKY